MNAVDELQRNGLPKSGLDEHHNFGPLSLRLINDVAAQTNGTVDLSKSNHTFAISEIWHAYIGHCLDFFCEENGMNMTYDDLRMMPDILNNYDSVEVFDKSGNLSLRYKKTYGDIEYTLIERIGSKHDYPRDTTQKAIWINDITKKASKAGVSPATRSQGIFARTEIVNPISAFIKQNYKEEAKKIALRMRNKKKGMIAPNGKRSNLPAELYVAVRLQSFKNWFGDWENTPDKASRVVDSNGEPMVVYHNSRHAGFVEFDSTLGDVRSNAPEGALFFSSSRNVAYSYSGTYEEADLWDADLQQDIEDYGIEEMPPGIYPVFLNIRDPHYIDFKGRNWDDGDFYSLVDDRGDYIYPKNGDEFYESEEAAQERAEELGLEDYEIYPEYKDTNLVAEEAQNMGADGAIIENVVDEGGYGSGIPATDFVVWNANQVKSATQNNADFSKADPRSTFSIKAGQQETTQQSIILNLRQSGQYDKFFEKVRELQEGGKPKGNEEDKATKYAPVSERLRNDILRLSNGDIDLTEGNHSVSVSLLWHSYCEHCLDFFKEGNQFNLTYDDIRMIPDIVENYDSIKIGTLNNGAKIEYTKRYGDIEYFVVETVDTKRAAVRGTLQKTIYVSDIIKKASDGSLHPTPSSKGFTRTERINPISTYIKQNYAKEAKKLPWR